VFDVNALAEQAINSVGSKTNVILGNVSADLNNRAFGLARKATTINLPPALGKLGLPRSINALDTIQSIFGVDIGQIFGLPASSSRAAQKAVPLKTPYDDAWNILQALMFKVEILGPGKQPIPDLKPYFIKSIDVGVPKLTTTKQRQGGIDRYYANDLENSVVPVGFYEDSNGSILKMYDIWSNTAFNRSTGVYGVPEGAGGYKGEIKFSIVNSSNSTILAIILKGAFPTDLTGYNFGVEGNRAISPTMIFSVDDIVLSF
jgi:hypothetical protein